MFKSNCHTHTNYCDGKNTAREMVEAAIEKGFVSLGFSGHSPMKHKNNWTMTVEGIAEYKKEIALLKEEYKDKIDILCGIELDKEYSGVNPEEFDYVIGSVHQFEKNGTVYDVDYSADMLREAADVFFGGSFNDLAGEYFGSLAEFVVREKVDVVGHIDLITKFNLDKPVFDETDELYRQHAYDAVDKILAAKPHVFFEVNTGAMFRKGKKTPYPASFILSYINKKGGKITLTSDTHSVVSVDYAFDKATQYIKNCGFDEIYYITGSGWKKYSLI